MFSLKFRLLLFRSCTMLLVFLVSYWTFVAHYCVMTQSVGINNNFVIIFEEVNT